MEVGHALITGGSSGIGLALARQLAAEGWHVSIFARDEERLHRAAKEIEALRRSANQRIKPIVADVSDSRAMVAAVGDAVAGFVAPSLAIANAGIVVPRRFDDLDLEDLTRMMAVNYFGSVHFVRAVLPHLPEKSRIVLMSSGAGLIAFYGYTGYAASKFAVRGFGEALRSELKPRKIGVSVVYPPDTQTPQLEEEIKTRPLATSRIAGGAKAMSADAVAKSILNGIAANRFAITPGLEMAALSLLHSLIGPLLHRFWFDPVIARTLEDQVRKK